MHSKQLKIIRNWYRIDEVETMVSNKINLKNQEREKGAFALSGNTNNKKWNRGKGKKKGHVSMTF